jgi:uncharacterized protein YegJ (DUF2314 family)
MSGDWTVPNSFLRVFDRLQGVCRVMAHEESVIEQAVTKYLDNGRDTLVTVETVEGGEYKILASDISSWMLTTVETRSRGWAVDKMLKEEQLASGWVDPE